MRKLEGSYFLFAGVCLLVLWVMLVVSPQVAAVRWLPLGFYFLLAAELLTAGFCLGTGYGLLRGKTWAQPVFFLTGGLLLASTYLAAFTYGLNPGYRSPALAGGLALLCLVTLLLLLRGLRDHPSGLRRPGQILLVFAGAAAYMLINLAGGLAERGAEGIGYFTLALALLAGVVYLATELIPRQTANLRNQPRPTTAATTRKPRR